MLKIKNINLYIGLVVLFSFSITYFVVVNKVSYGFVTNEETLAYENKMNIIKKEAERYAIDNIDLFSEKESIYIIVDDLVKNEYLLADNENGDVFEANSKVKKMNDTKIRITYKDEKFNIKIIV